MFPSGSQTPPKLSLPSVLPWLNFPVYRLLTCYLSIIILFITDWRNATQISCHENSSEADSQLINRPIERQLAVLSWSHRGGGEKIGGKWITIPSSKRSGFISALRRKRRPSHTWPPILYIYIYISIPLATTPRLFTQVSPVLLYLLASQPATPDS